MLDMVTFLRYYMRIVRLTDGRNLFRETPH